MVMGRAFVLKNKSPDRSSQSFTKRSFAFIGCIAVYNCTLGAMRTLFPILIILSSKRTVHIDNDLVTNKDVLPAFAMEIYINAGILANAS